MKRSELVQIIKEEVAKAMEDPDIKKILKQNQKTSEEIIDAAEKHVEDVTKSDKK